MGPRTTKQLEWTPERRAAHSKAMKEAWASARDRMTIIPSTPLSYDNDFEAINDIAPPYVTENVLKQALAQLQTTLGIDDSPIVYYSRQLNKYIVTIEVDNCREFHHKPTQAHHG